MKKKKLNNTDRQYKEYEKIRNKFRNKIENIFIRSGFTRLITKTFNMGSRDHEIDHCFIYENIIIICEDTTEKINPQQSEQSSEESHKLRKQETAACISKNQNNFIEILKKRNLNNTFLNKYCYSRFKIYYLYFEYGAKNINEETKNRYRNIIFIDESTLNYFDIMSKSIKASFRYEIFKFLGLSQSDIGIAEPYSDCRKTISASIIYPEQITGYSNGVRMVSFMMKPIDLLQNACVLRKDSWQKNIDLYQRLIEPKRIKQIRNFVCNNKCAFLNNIIVTLPDNIKFEKNNEIINIDDITQYENNIKMSIPSEFNSIVIIDGQHRVYSYYEDFDSNSQSEKIISSLRNELNLLVTGIVYPKKTIFDDNLQRRKFESNLFVSINKNAKSVDSDTLIQVQSILNPTSGEALSRKVIQKMNKRDPFKEMFQLSKVEKAPIKVASIIQYALSSLLYTKFAKTSLYYYWIIKNNLSNDFLLKDSKQISDYVDYCAYNLSQYFLAIKKAFSDCWNENSKLLKVISLNAFLIAYRDTLEECKGPQKEPFYYDAFKKLKIDFSCKENKFRYGGAQYSKFANEIIIPAINDYLKKINNDSSD